MSILVDTTIILSDDDDSNQADHLGDKIDLIIKETLHESAEELPFSKKMPIPEILIILSDDESDSNVDVSEILPVKQPLSSALKNIGISIIRLQYDHLFSVTSRSNLPRISKSNREDWESLYPEDRLDSSYKDYRYLLETNYKKTYRCKNLGRRICQDHGQMTRLEWINHRRRGHVKINRSWKNILKKNNNSKVEKVFDVLCLFCSRSRKHVFRSPMQFVKHIRKRHPRYLAYDKHLSYFQRCFLCNALTKTSQENIIHRQNCLGQLRTDFNQVSTKYFNKSFETQRQMPTFSLQSNVDGISNFGAKRKCLAKDKSTLLGFWMEVQNGPDYQETIHNTLPIISRKSRYQRPLLPANRPRNTAAMAHGPVPVTPIIEPNKVQTYSIVSSLPKKQLTENDPMYIKWRNDVNGFHSNEKNSLFWQCEICEAYVKNGRLAYCHVKMNHYSIPFASLLNLNSCLICLAKSDNIRYHLQFIHDMSDSSHGHLAVGQLTYHNGQFHSCERCSETYPTESLLRSHMNLKKHYIECPMCTQMRFNLPMELMLHLTSSHVTVTKTPPRSNGSFVCDICHQDNDSKDGDNDECLVVNVAFASLTEKMDHVIKSHTSPCHVVLEDYVSQRQ